MHIALKIEIRDIGVDGPAARKSPLRLPCIEVEQLIDHRAVGSAIEDNANSFVIEAGTELGIGSDCIVELGGVVSQEMIARSDEIRSLCRCIGRRGNHLPVR